LDQSLSACRPASVILMRTTSITARPGPLTTSRSAYCKAFVNETRDHVAIESVGNDEHLLRDAIRNACEQRQCAAPLVPSKVWFSSMCCHVCREVAVFACPRPQAGLHFCKMQRPTFEQGAGGMPSHRAAAVTIGSDSILGRPIRRQPDRATLVPFREPI
jgi:hypothetical protein